MKTKLLSLILVLTANLVFGQTKAEIQNFEKIKTNIITLLRNDINKIKSQTVDKSTMTILQSLDSIAVKQWNSETEVYDTYTASSKYHYEASLLDYAISHSIDLETSEEINNKSVYTHETDGTLTEVINYSLNDAEEWVESSKNEYVYAAGKIDYILTYEWDPVHSAWLNKAKDYYAYEADDEIVTSITSFEWEVGTETWNRVIRRLYTYTDETLDAVLYQNYDAGDWVDFVLLNYTYEDGDLISLIYDIFYMGSWLTIAEATFTYDNAYTFSDLRLPDLSIENAMLFNHKLISMEFQVLNFETFELENASSITYYYEELDTTSTDEITLENLQVYPNPCTDQIQFSVSNDVTTLSVNIYDVQGRKVIDKMISNAETVNTETLSKGVYFYQVSANANTSNGRFVKE